MFIGNVAYSFAVVGSLVLYDHICLSRAKCKCSTTQGTHQSQPSIRCTRFVLFVVHRQLGLRTDVGPTLGSGESQPRREREKSRPASQASATLQRNAASKLCSDLIFTVLSADFRSASLSGLFS